MGTFSLLNIIIWPVWVITLAFIAMLVEDAAKEEEKPIIKK